MIHGDDWKTGYESTYRVNCIKELKKYGGKLIEVPHTKGISSAALINYLNTVSTTPDIRRGLLRRMIDSKKSRFRNPQSNLSHNCSKY